MSSKIVLSVGSNCSKNNVEKSIDWLGSFLLDFKVSSIYSTPSTNGHEIRYDNAVIFASVDHDLESFNNLLKQYEISQGRNAEAKCLGVVPIDIDIVICDGKVLRPRDYDQPFFQIGYKEILEDKY